MNKSFPVTFIRNIHQVLPLSSSVLLRLQSDGIHHPVSQWIQCPRQVRDTEDRGTASQLGTAKLDKHIEFNGPKQPVKLRPNLLIPPATQCGVCALPHSETCSRT